MIKAHYSKLLAIFTLCFFISLSGCKDTSEDTVDSTVSSGCTAESCHQYTELGVYPPTSGQHPEHLPEPGSKCTDCHYQYANNELHKNNIKNGYDAQLKTAVDGVIVIFDSSRFPNTAWDNETKSCTNIDCHSHTSITNPNKDVDWYNGCGMSCHYKNPPQNPGCTSSCHYKVPDTGIHTKHLESKKQTLSCPDCHKDYTSMANTTHKDGTINGYDYRTSTQKDGVIVYFNTDDNPSATWDNSTGICSNLACHKKNYPAHPVSNETQDWYNGCKASCHN